MSYETIQTEVRAGVGLIRLDRPEALNALNSDMLRELSHALDTFEADDDVGAVVITGNEKAFAAGADIKGMEDASPADMMRRDSLGGYDRLRACKKPLIAAVSGWCLGGGNEVAMSCDMIVASASARFGQPEVNLGIIPGAGGTQLLTRAVGKAIAMEMILNNRTLSAEEALSFGLINAVHPVETYLEEAIDLASQLAARAPLAVRMAKEMVSRAFELSLSEGIAAERAAFYFLFSTEDQSEGMRAFIEKRAAQWKGR
jgi:enoyl-CoA hydratase